MCEHCAQLQAALIDLAELVREHFRAGEERADYIAFGPEPSDRAGDIIERLRQVCDE